MESLSCDRPEADRYPPVLWWCSNGVNSGSAGGRRHGNRSLERSASWSTSMKRMSMQLRLRASDSQSSEGVLTRFSLHASKPADPMRMGSQTLPLFFLRLCFLGRLCADFLLRRAAKFRLRDKRLNLRSQNEMRKRKSDQLKQHFGSEYDRVVQILRRSPPRRSRSD
jgi:hypothetical protein